MDRVSSNGYQTVGGVRYWQNKNQPGGIQGTTFDQVWFNGVQESIVETIFASGQAAADSAQPAPDTQLLQAVLGFSGANVRTITVSPGAPLAAIQAGLVLVNASAGNIAIILPLADALGGFVQVWKFVRIDATTNAVSIAFSGTDSILPGGSSAPLPLAPGGNFDLVADGGSQWVQRNPIGRLLGQQVFETPGTFTYTPTLGTNSVVVDVQGAGGPGCGSPATGAGQTSQGGNGSAGSYARKRILAGFSGVSITVGAGGVGASGGVGTNGGASSFGTIVSAAGGLCGNNQGSTSAVSYFVPSASLPALPMNGDINIQGAAAGNNFTTGSMGIIAGAAYGMFAAGYGAAGYGFPNGPSSAALAGSNGYGGLVIVWEFS